MECPTDSVVVVAAADPVICSFFLENRCRFADQCRNLHPSEFVSSLPNPPRQQKNEPIKIDGKPNRDSRKKTRMRTASDAIHRITWDPELNPSDFQVVYLDRFTGLVSIPLTEFTSQNTDEPLAIPQHRIQQICYCPSSVSHIVWDKQSRTDNIFGSVGGPALLDFIRSVNDPPTTLDER